MRKEDDTTPCSICFVWHYVFIMFCNKTFVSRISIRVETLSRDHIFNFVNCSYDMAFFCQLMFN